MAFEAFVRSGSSDPGDRWFRRGGFITAAAVHIGLLTVGIILSYWQVDEVSPPLVVITRMPTMQRDAPAEVKPLASPSRGAERGKSRLQSPPRGPAVTAAMPKAVPVAPQPAAPTVAPSTPPDTESAGPGGAALSGDQAGLGEGPGGVSAAGDGGGEARSVLPPSVGAKRCLSCPSPHLPPGILSAASTGQQIWLVKICVDARGRVTSVRTLSGILPAVDQSLAATVRTWEFAPMTVAGHEVPFCYVSRFVFSGP